MRVCVPVCVPYWSWISLLGLWVVLLRWYANCACPFKPLKKIDSAFSVCSYCQGCWLMRPVRAATLPELLSVRWLWEWDSLCGWNPGWVGVGGIVASSLFDQLSSRQWGIISPCRCLVEMPWSLYRELWHVCQLEKPVSPPGDTCVVW